MKKWILIASLFSLGTAKAQHTAGEWFINAGGKPPLNLQFKNFSIHAQTGYFVTPRLAFGAQIQYQSAGSSFKEQSYSIFSRYYLMNQEKFGLYTFASFGRAEAHYKYYNLSNQNYFTAGLGLGADVKITENWRLNLEVSLLGSSYRTSSGTLGLSYTIPYRKANRKKGVL